MKKNSMICGHCKWLRSKGSSWVCENPDSSLFGCQVSYPAEGCEVYEQLDRIQRSTGVSADLLKRVQLFIDREWTGSEQDAFAAARIEPSESSGTTESSEKPKKKKFLSGFGAFEKLHKRSAAKELQSESCQSVAEDSDRILSDALVTEDSDRILSDALVTEDSDRILSDALVTDVSDEILSVEADECDRKLGAAPADEELRSMPCASAAPADEELRSMPCAGAAPVDEELRSMPCASELPDAAMEPGSTGGRFSGLEPGSSETMAPSYAPKSAAGGESAFEPDSRETMAPSYAPKSAAGGDSTFAPGSSGKRFSAYKAKSIDEILAGLGQTFQEKLLSTIDAKGMTDAQVYTKANLDRRLFSKIRCNKNYKPSKSTALALAIALNLNLDETTDLLQRAGLALSPSSKADIIVKYCILNQIDDILDVNAILYEYDQPLLGY